MCTHACMCGVCYAPVEEKSTKKQIRQIERNQENMNGNDTNNSKMPRRKEK